MVYKLFSRVSCRFQETIACGVYASIFVNLYNEEMNIKFIYYQTAIVTCYFICQFLHFHEITILLPEWLEGIISISKLNFENYNQYKLKTKLSQ